MFNLYKEKVILAYQKKRNEGTISINLLQPSPGKLKTECIHVYQERPLKKDENLLKSFFGPKDNTPDYSQNIRKSDVDKFRPLKNFINRKTSDPDERIVELLSWLIDFEPRPFRPGYNYKQEIKFENIPDILNNSGETKEESTEIPTATLNREDNNVTEIQLIKEKERISNNEIKDKKIKEKSGIYISEERYKNSKEVKPLTRIIQPVFGEVEELKNTISKEKVKRAIAYFMIIIAVSSSLLYLFVTNNRQCMYWTGDHYEPVSCSKKRGTTSIIAIDPIKVSQLRKITRPDTLTQNSLGKIWYVKIEDNVEFYTSDGFHPIYTDKRLKPITKYILNKYVN